MSQNSLSFRLRGDRRRLWVLAACVSAAGATLAPGAAPTGGNGLKLNAIAEINSDSNVFGDTSDVSDMFYTFMPQVSFDREGARGRAHFDAGVGFDRYSDYDQLNSDNWAFNGAIEMPPGTGGRLSGSLNVSYFDGNESDDYVGQRVEMQRLSFGLGSSYELSGRTSFRFGANVSNYETNLRPKSDSWAVRGGLAMRFRPSLSAFLDYSHGATSSAAIAGSTFASDYTTDNVSVGLDGQFNPNLNGSVSVGYDSYSARTGDTAGDGNNFTVNVALKWQVRQNTEVSLNGGKDNRVVASGESIDATRASIGIRQRFSRAVSASASLLWETFSDRGANSASNDRVAAQLDIDYALNEHLAFGAGVRHNVRYSDDPNFDISRTLLKLFGRYTF